MSDDAISPAPAPASASGSGGWERLDVVAVVPRRGITGVAGESTGVSDERARPLRLRRSRSHVLAALDAGGSMLQRRGRDLLVGSSILLLPVVALNLWVTSQAFDRTGATTLTAFGGDGVGTGLEDVAAMLAVLCASLAAAVVGCFCAIILLADRFGHPAGLWPALAGTMRRLPTVLVAWAIGHFWLPFLATWSLSGNPGESGGRMFLVIPLAVVFAMATLLVVPAIVAEQLGPFAALRRSWRLARLRAGSTLGFVCSSFVVGVLLLAGITSLPALAEVSGFLAFGDYRWLVQGVASQLATIIVVPLTALATAHLYLLLRVDAEGLDIAIDADAAFGPVGGRGIVS